MKKLLLILFLGMLLVIPVVSAARIDYSPNDKGVNDMKAHVKDTILFGLIQIGEQGTMELKSHKTPTEIIDVSPGWDVTMKYELNFNELISYGLGDVYFIDLRTGKEVEREYKFVYWGTEERSRDTYETICETNTTFKNETQSCYSQINGTETYTYEGWLDYTSKDIPKGKITLGLMVNNKVNDYIDGVWEVAGKKLSKHAGWQASLDNGLVSWYSLDETTGTTAFDSLGRNDGTNNGTTINQTGKVNRSYDFERDNGNYISLPSGVATSIGSGSFSISMWINPETSLSGTQYTVLLWNNPGSANEFRIHYYNGVLFFATIRSEEGWISAEKTISLNAGSWYYITATYNSSTKKQNIYVNAITGTEATRATATNAFSETTYLGKRDTTTTTNPDEFDGKIDEVAIWNRTLTTDEIALLYNDGDGLGYQQVFGAVTSLSPINNFNSSSKDITFIGNTIQESVTNFSLIIDDVYEQTNTSGLSGNYTFTETLDDGVYSWKFESCNASECMNSTARTLTVDSTAPTIDLISPNSTYNYLKEGDTLYLQGFANDSNLDTVWYEYNGTNTTFSATTATLFNESITQADSSKLSLTLWANDTIGNTNREVISWDYKVFENDRIYSLNAYETEMKDFIINLTYNSSTFVPTVYLNYDGTNYSTINIGSGNEGKFKNTVSIGLIDGSTSKEFYWWILANDSVIKTESNNQTINNLIFQICNGTYTNKTLNFKFYDESKNTLLNSTLNPLTFETYFEFWVGNGDIKKSYNYNVQNTTTGSYDFCISPANFSFNSNLQISYSAEDYSKRESSYNELNLTNIIQNISFYLLPTELSTKFTHYVRQEIEALAGVSVEVYKFLISTGNYTLISTKTTDENGRFVEWLELDQKYKYTVKSEGISLTEQEKQAICAVSPCEITLQIDEVSLNAFNELNAYFAQNVDYNLTYNKSTSTFKLSFLDLTGTANYWRLYVYKSNSNNDTLNSICNLYAYSSSGELECDTSLYFGEITAKVYISRSPEKLVDFLIRVNENITPVLSVSGLLASIIILLVIIFTGTRNPTSALLMLPFGLIILKFIGFMPLTWGWIAGITIFILAISYKMNT